MMGIYADETQEEQLLLPVEQSVNLFDSALRKHHHHDDKQECEVQTAYFFLRPNDVDDPITVDDEDPIYWQYDLFTIKTEGINIGGTNSPDIEISHQGVYLISWTVFARSNDSDWISAELQIDGSPVRGSRYTSVNSAEDEASQLIGQAIVFIPKDSTLQLVNVTGYGISFTTENEGGRNGVIASIAITQIKADDID